MKKFVLFLSLIFVGCVSAGGWRTSYSYSAFSLIPSYEYDFSDWWNQK